MRRMPDGSRSRATVLGLTLFLFGAPERLGGAPGPEMIRSGSPSIERPDPRLTSSILFGFCLPIRLVS